MTITASTITSTTFGYASASDVAAISHGLLGGASVFSASSSPTLNEVNVWLTTGCSIIEAALAGSGYTTPVASTAVAYGWLRELNARFAAAQAEISRINITLGPGERTRGQVFDQMFWDGLKRLGTMARGAGSDSLGLTPATPSSTRGKLHIGGISVATKEGQETDTDRVTPRFVRGQFGISGTTQPTKTSNND